MTDMKPGMVGCRARMWEDRRKVEDGKRSHRAGTVRNYTLHIYLPYIDTTTKSDTLNGRRLDVSVYKLSTDGTKTHQF